MTNRSNLPKVEQLLDYPFVDKSLGTAALRTDRRGFSRLEFLGDAIMGLSVYTVAMCRGLPKRHTDRLLSNKYLAEIYRSRFAGCASNETGDVVEALVAAIYLDGGFLRAASVTASLLLGEHGDFNFAATQDLATKLAPRQIFQLGAQVSKAVIADHLTTTSPNQLARWYSDTSQNLLTVKRVAKICRGHPLEDFGIPLEHVGIRRPPEPERVRRALSEIKTEKKIKLAPAQLKDMVDGYAALQYLKHGWLVAKNNISTLLEVSSTPRT